MRIRKRIISLLIALMSVLIIILIANSRSVGRVPVLKGLSSSTVQPGEEIELSGKYFGDSKVSGKVFLDGVAITQKHIIKWTDDTIVLLFPETAQSGLISVGNMFGKSDAYLITRMKDVPIVLTDHYLPGYPYLDTATFSDRNESILVIEGRHFGAERGLSELVISEKNPGSDKESYFPLSSKYIKDWEDNRIELYFPIQWRSGRIYIKSPKGFSNFCTFERRRKSSVTYEYDNKKSYSLKQVVDVKEVASLKSGTLELWLSTPLDELNQKNIVISSPKGVFRDNTLYYTLRNLQSGEEYSLDARVSLDVYDMDAKVNAGLVSSKYDINSPEYLEGFIPVKGIFQYNKDIKYRSSAVVRGEANVYRKAYKIYDWILRYIKYSSEGEVSADRVFSVRKAENEGFVNLFCSMLRSAGIPARPVKGVEVRGDTAFNYHWAEFYISNGGWIPVDIFSDALTGKRDRFSSVDNSKIAFSRGVKDLGLKGDDIRTVYARQSIYERVRGNLERYRTIWHNVAVE